MRHHGFYRYHKPITWLRVEKIYAFGKRHKWAKWFLDSIVRQP